MFDVTDTLFVCIQWAVVWARTTSILDCVWRVQQGCIRTWRDSQTVNLVLTADLEWEHQEPRESQNVKVRTPTPTPNSYIMLIFLFHMQSDCLSPKYLIFHLSDP